MPEVLPEFPDIDLLRREAHEVDSKLAESEESDSDAPRVSAYEEVARRYGFPSWSRLEVEVERKNAFHSGDAEGLAVLLGEYAEMAITPVSSCFENDSPLGYLGVARFHGLGDHGRYGALAEVLLLAGALPDGALGTPEPPLVTAASYGEIEIVEALIEAGADLELTGFAVPGGTALSHAVEFGNTAVVDLLVRSGAIVHGLIEAAGAGDVNSFLNRDAPVADKARALRAAALNERLEVIDLLLKHGLTVDADPESGLAGGSRSVLHDAAYAGKPKSVTHLLTLGADPNKKDAEYGSTPLGWCRHRHRELAMFGDHLTAGHWAVEDLLAPVTRE